jgi:choline dehydrogenase
MDPLLFALISKDPFEKPSIVFNYLSTKEDEQEWVEAIRVARNWNT